MSEDGMDVEKAVQLETIGELVSSRMLRAKKTDGGKNPFWGRNIANAIAQTDNDFEKIIPNGKVAFSHALNEELKLLTDAAFAGEPSDEKREQAIDELMKKFSLKEEQAGALLNSSMAVFLQLYPLPIGEKYNDLGENPKLDLACSIWKTIAERSQAELAQT